MSAFFVYDCEIIKAIAGKNEPHQPDVEYCDGWRDFGNMGISVIGGYDYETERYRVFTSEGFHEFQSLASERRLVSFNGKNFDDPLCAANGLEIRTDYDILVEMWRASGLPETYQSGAQSGFGLDATAEANLGRRKTGHGALAPVLWQRGAIGQVIDYCLEDVHLEKMLFDRILFTGKLCGPSCTTLMMRRPMGEF